ncbi:MAG: hypothetical protein MZV64_28255 [Ignavibacteriales bacterium]|nr:hypothetical protein [Ignavibacteriales bacterium]
MISPATVSLTRADVADRWRSRAWRDGPGHQDSSHGGGPACWLRCHDREC